MSNQKLTPWPVNEQLTGSPSGERSTRLTINGNLEAYRTMAQPAQGFAVTQSPYPTLFIRGSIERIMTPETPHLPPTPPEPSKETIAEMSLGAAMRRVIEDLFTYRAIGEKMKAIPPNDVLPALLETWKQGLTHKLQTEAYVAVENVSGILDLLQGDEPLSAMEPLEWQEAERWYAPFPIATVCRENLRSVLPDEAIAQLRDEDMSQIAARMGETFQYSDMYWQSLEVTAKTVLDEKQALSVQLPEPQSPTPPSENPA